MNDILTDARDSCVSEKYDETSDAHKQLTKRQSTENIRFSFMARCFFFSL